MAVKHDQIIIYKRLGPDADLLMAIFSNGQFGRAFARITLIDITKGD